MRVGAGRVSLYHAVLDCSPGRDGQVTCQHAEDCLGQPGERAILIPGAAGGLEAVLSVPQSALEGTAFPTIVAVICHPHPLMGGTMQNKVVFTLHRACRDLGMATIRFNFRGVGASAGAYGEGVGEQEDLLAVLAWLDTLPQRPALVLAGFSFGSWVTASVLARVQAAGWALRTALLVAPPVTRFPLDGLVLPPVTRAIYGDADEVVDPVAMADWLRRALLVEAVTCLAGAGHFFHARLGELKDWATRCIQNSGVRE